MKRLYHVFILFVGEKYKKKYLNPNNYSLLFKLVCISLLFPAMKGLHTKIWSLQSIFHVDRSRRSYFVNNLFILKFNCFFSFSFHVVFANEWTLDHYTWSFKYMIADETESGIGLCGWILTAISWGLVMVTLPFSLCVCFKVVKT